MTSHQQQIARALLAALHDRDGGVMAEPLLHGEVRQRTNPPATLSDFELVLRAVENLGWITGVTGALGGRTWGLTETGEVKHRQFNVA